MQLSQPQLFGTFLWLTDLGKPDPYYILGVLSVLGQLLVQLMATPRVQDAQQKAMTQSMLILPLMFGYLGFTFPAGAVLYWVIGSVLLGAIPAVMVGAHFSSKGADRYIRPVLVAVLLSTGPTTSPTAERSGLSGESSPPRTSSVIRVKDASTSSSRTARLGRFFADDG